LRQDIDALKAVRGAIGPDIELMCDFNQGLALRQKMGSCLPPFLQIMMR